MKGSGWSEVVIEESIFASESIDKSMPDKQLNCVSRAPKVTLESLERYKISRHTTWKSTKDNEKRSFLQIF